MVLHRAFTLIELMIAMALGVAIVVIAYMALGSTLRTFGTMNRTAVENSLLRTGYFTVVEDADFWHPQANPDYPYLKGFMSDDVTGADGDSDHAANKRLFRPVAFPMDLDDPRNPNWQQPNDRRAWYRNLISQNQSILSRLVDVELDKAMKDPIWTPPNFPEPGFNQTRAGDGAMPIGWHPWHVHGDYSLTANLGMDTKIVLSTSTDDALRGAKPVLIWDLFKKIGYQGVIAYSAPGTMNLILRPSTNLTVAAIGNPDLHYDKGEIPWMLTTPRVDVIVQDQRPITVWAQGTVTVPGAVVPGVTARDRNIGHYAEAMPAFPFWGPGDRSNDQVMLPILPFAADLNICTSDSEVGPVSLLYTTRPSGMDQAGKIFDYARTIDRRSRRPYHYDYSIYARSWYAEAFAAGRNEGMATTWLVPSAQTDVPEPSIGSQPTNSPALQVSIYRHRLNSHDKALCSVRLREPVMGRTVELRFALTTTTYRGARQHWGWRSQFAEDAVAIKDMGDSYR